MFCKKCNELLYPSKGKMVCRECKWVLEEGKIVDKKKKTKKLEVIDKNLNMKMFPKVKQDCEKCSCVECYFFTRQTRSADEPETKFYKCVKCGHIWRDYS